MGNRSRRGRHPVRDPPRIRPITIRRPRTNHAPMRYHNRRLRSDEHRAHRRLQSPLGAEGHPPGDRHPQLECHDRDIELARNRLSRNPSTRHNDLLLWGSGAERQTAGRTRKPVWTHAAAHHWRESHWVDTEGARKPGQPHASVALWQQIHWVDTEGARKPGQPHAAAAQ